MPYPLVTEEDPRQSGNMGWQHHLFICVHSLLSQSLKPLSGYFQRLVKLQVQSIVLLWSCKHNSGHAWLPAVLLCKPFIGSCRICIFAEGMTSARIIQALFICALYAVFSPRALKLCLFTAAPIWNIYCFFPTDTEKMVWYSTCFAWWAALHPTALCICSFAFCGF